MQREAPLAARALLVEALGRLGQTRHTLDARTDDFRTLWLRENRTYALDHVLERFDAQRATFGSNDGITVFLNGEVVFDNQVKRNLAVDEDEAWLPLKKGRNDLMLKVSQGASGWGFSFRLPDEIVRSRKNRYRILDE